MNYLPWHREQFQALAERTGHAGRLPHALLLTGTGGIGKRQFAHAVAQGHVMRTRFSGLECLWRL